MPDVETLVYVFSVLELFSALISIVAYNKDIAAAYGKHSREGNTVIDARLAWIIQEAPSFLIAFSVTNQAGFENIGYANKVIVGLFMAHYFFRSFIYPILIMNKNSKPFSVRVMLFGIIFTSMNGYAIANYEVFFGKLPDTWTSSLQFNAGVLIWLLGFSINVHSDRILRNLRKPGDTDYKIPRGGAFEFVSGANYFGEIVEWWGLAIASGFHFPVTCFALATTGNIGTRSLAHHNYYKKKFKDYPLNRKAFIPFIM